MAAGAAALFVVSRGKWSDAIIDSGREWIVPDALARGELLYRDVVYWFGPLTPYAHAAVFRVLGSSFATLVVAGALGACAALLAFHLALRRVTGRSEAAYVTALAVPVLVFMPNAGGPLLGMGYRIWHAATFALFAIAAVTVRRSVGSGRALAAGALCGLAGLCRTEWGFLALFSVLAALARRRGARPWRPPVLAVAAFAAVFATVLGGFLLAAGAGAVLRDGHVLLTGLPEETRTFLVRFSGLADWRSGTLEMLYSAGLWLGLALAVRALALWREEGARRRLILLGACLAGLALLALLGGAAGAILYSGAPLACLAAVVAGLSLPRGSRAAALIGFGIFGFLASGRRLFHIGDSGYVGPPILVALVCVAGLLRLAVVRQRGTAPRRRLRKSFRVALGCLIGLAFVGRTLEYASDERVAIAGTQGMLSARPELAARLAGTAQMLAARRPGPGGLVVFPEGEILNALSGLPNPIRHKLYIPGYLTESNEAQVVAELERSPPAAIVVVYRPTSEYGPGLFGVDYGRDVMGWIERHYAWDEGDGRDRVVSRVGSWLRVAFRRPGAGAGT